MLVIRSSVDIWSRHTVTSLSLGVLLKQLCVLHWHALVCKALSTMITVVVMLTAGSFERYEIGTR